MNVIISSSPQQRLDLEFTLADIRVTLGSESHILAFSQSAICSVSPVRRIALLLTYFPPFLSGMASTLPLVPSVFPILVAVAN